MKPTMRVLNNAVVLLLVALLYHQTCLAQVEPWERVKLIEPGKNVNVKLHSGKTVRGRMASWNPDELTVRQGKDKVVPVAKSDVAKVALVIGRSRKRKAAYAGLITGGIMGGLVGVACVREGCGGNVVGIGLGAAFGGALIAAGITALFPQHNEVIYTAGSAPLAGSTPKP